MNCINRLKIMNLGFEFVSPYMKNGFLFEREGGVEFWAEETRNCVGPWSSPLCQFIEREKHKYTM